MSTTVEKMMTRSGVSINLMKMPNIIFTLYNGRLPEDENMAKEMLVVFEESELRELVKMIKKYLPKKKKKKNGKKNKIRNSKIS